MVKATGAGAAQRRARRLLGPFASWRWDIQLDGFERLPADGPAILCPNHISFLDSAFLMLSVPRNISFVGKAEYMESWKTKYLFPVMGMIPIDRSGGSKAALALEAAATCCDVASCSGSSPRARAAGTAGCTRAAPGRHGWRSRSARRSIPVGIVGTDRIQPPDAKAPKLVGSCSITIGRPIAPQRYAAMPERHRALRAMTDEVMFEIRELTGQEYVNRYAGKSDDAERRAPPSRPGRVTSPTRCRRRRAPADRQLASVAS